MWSNQEPGKITGASLLFKRAYRRSIKAGTQELAIASEGLCLSSDGFDRGRIWADCGFPLQDPGLRPVGQRQFFQ